MDMAEWVMVDDADPSITYTGDWFANTGSLDSSGTFGPPFLSTVHGTQGLASLSFNFSGSSFTVFGAVQVPRAPNSGNTTWQCVVDGTPISVEDPSNVGNRQSFCSDTALADGPHQVVVDAVGTPQQTFWFDYVQYIPSTSVSLTDTTTMVEFTSEQIQYSPAWTFFTSGTMTNLTNSSASYTFEGVSLSWYGLYNSTAFPSGESMSTYSVDGGTPSPFILNGAGATEIPMLNQVFFSIKGLSPGTHALEVVYNGNTSVTPLTVQSIVRFGKVVTTSSSGSTSTTVSLTPPTSSVSSTPPTSSSHSLSLSSSSASLSPNGTSTVSTFTLTSSSTSSSVPADIGMGMFNTSVPTISAPTSTSSASHQHGNASKPNTSIIIVPIAALFLFLLTIGLVCLRRKHRRKRTASARPFPYSSGVTNVTPARMQLGNLEASQSQPECVALYGKVPKQSGILGMARTVQVGLPTLSEEREGEVPALRVQVGNAPPPAYILL